MAFSCLELLFVTIELTLCLAGEKEENQARNKDSGESATWHKHNWSSGDCQRPCCKCCLSTTLHLMSGNMHSSRTDCTVCHLPSCRYAYGNVCGILVERIRSPLLNSYSERIKRVAFFALYSIHKSKT